MGNQYSNAEGNCSAVDTSLYTTILDNSSDPMFCFDETGKYLYVNHAFSAPFKKQPSDIIGKRIWDIFPESEGDERFAAVKLVFETGETKVIEVKVQAENSLLYYMTSIIPIKDSAGCVQKAICISKDITDRKLAEEELLKTKEHFEMIFNSSPNATLISRLDDGMILNTNKGFSDLTNYTRDEVVGKNITEFNIYVNQNDRQKILEELSLNVSISNREVHFRKRNGDQFIGSVSAQKFTGHGVPYIISVTTDVSNIKEREDAVARLISDRDYLINAYKESEELYKGLFEYSGVAMGYYKIDGTVLSYNRKAAENMGGKPEDYAGKSLYDLFPREDADLYMGRIAKAVSSESTQEYEDFISLSPGTKWFHSTFNRILDSNGNIAGIQIISQDITSRRQTEDALRENDAKHETMIANIGDVIGIVGTDGFIKYKSPNIEKWFGWKPEDLVGTAGWKTVHPDDMEYVQKEFLELFEKENATSNIEYKYKCKNGSYLWVELTAVNCVKNPSINGILLNYHNITERRKNVEEIRSSEEKYRLLITQMQQGIAVHEVVQDDSDKVIDYRFLDINDSFERITGLSKNIIGKTVLEIMPNTENDWIKRYGQVAMTGVPLYYENYSQELGRYYEAVAYSPRYKQFAVIVSDITERKELEASVNRSRSLLETTLLSVGDGVISTDKNGKVVLLNRVAENLTGWTQENAIGVPITKVFSIIHEYTREKCDNIVEKVLSCGTTLELENHTILISKDGTERPIEDSAAPIIQEDGVIAGVVLVFRDCTEKKKKQEEIEFLSFHDQLTGLYNRRYYEEELRKIDTENNLPITLVMADVNGLKLTNDAFGHKAGDELLVEIANIIKRECRTGEVVSRIGGDEFVILLPQTDAENAHKIIERIRKAIANENKSHAILSVSIGFAVKQNAQEKMNDIFKEAEDVMYGNKLFESASMRSKTIDLIMNSLYEKNCREMQHSKRVSMISESIAVKLNLHNDEVYQIKMAGLMHDIGKIGVDDAILNKTGKLDIDEWNEIKRHSDIGYRILSSVNEFSRIADYVLEHHERWDGKGYPKGNKGDAIPLASRIIAIADSFDAMTSDRVYRKAFQKIEAINEMKANKGLQFDPFILDVFIENVLV